MAKYVANLQSQSLDEKPIVLFLSDNYSSYLNDLVEFLAKKNLQILKFKLSDLKDKKELLKKYRQLEGREVYKVIISYGFLGYKQVDLRLMTDFLLAIKELQVNANYLFLNSYTTPFRLLDSEAVGLDQEFETQSNYLETMLNNFPKANFYLAKDILLDPAHLPLSLKLCLSTVTNNLILDPGLNFHWQSKKQWMDFLQEQVLKPVRGERIILRGRQEKSGQLTINLEQLLERYFQLELKVLPCLTEKLIEEMFLIDFTKVTKADKQVRKVFDQFLRQFPKIKAQLNLSLSTPATKQSEKPISSVTKTVKKPVLVESEQLLPIDKKELKIESNKSVSPPLKSKSKKVVNEDKNTGESSKISNELEKIFKEGRQEEKQIRAKSNLRSNRRIIEKTRKRRFLFYVGALVFSLGLVLLTTLASFYFSQIRLKKLISQGSGEKNYQSSLVYKVLSWEVGKAEQFLGEEQLSGSREVLNLARLLDRDLSAKSASRESFFGLYQDTLRGDGDLENTWQELELNIGESLRVAEDLNQFLTGLNFDILATKEAASMMELKERNQLELRMLGRLDNIFKPVKELLISPARTKLAILIQDDAELRGGGGFLTSILVLSFENGFLIDRQVLSVADLDSQLYGERELNPEIQALFGGEQALLRDSNFSADFNRSSQEINWFLEQSSGHIDWLLTLKSSDLRALLEILGDLKVENDNQLIVNSLNLFEQLEQNWLEDNQKTNGRFYEAVVQALWLRMEKLSEDELISVSRYILEQLEKKEIFTSSSEGELSDSFTNNLWTGKKLNTVCPVEFRQAAGGCFLDGVFQVENNLSLNKVNPYIKEEIKHSVGVSENFIRHKRVIKYQNFARQSTWPQGDYLAYLKFYLPEKANIERLKINGELLGAGSYQTRIENSNLILTLRLSVPVKKEVELELVYLLEHDLKAPFSYVFLEQKQAGMFDKNTNYSVVFAEDFKPRLIAPQADYEQQVVSFNNPNNDHFVFALSFD